MPERIPTAVRSARQPDRLDPALLTLGAIVVLGAITTMLDMTMVNVALATLIRTFATSIATIQWVSTGYLLAIAMVIPVTGWAVERFGSKAMWMFALSIFMAGSALCGAAWSASSLITFRVIQGIGGGMIVPLSMTILAQAAGPHRRGRLALTLSLLSWGLGIAAITVPVMAAAYLDLAPTVIPRATSAITTVQTVGASFGAAVLAVVLQHQLAGDGHGGGAAAAFGATFWWTLGCTALAVVPVWLLPRKTN